MILAQSERNFRKCVSNIKDFFSKGVPCDSILGLYDFISILGQVGIKSILVWL